MYNLINDTVIYNKRMCGDIQCTIIIIHFIQNNSRILRNMSLRFLCNCFRNRKEILTLCMAVMQLANGPIASLL